MNKNTENDLANEINKITIDNNWDRLEFDGQTLSANRQVYSQIKEEILTNRLRPGNQLTHQRLAEDLNVSRTPVREALERLDQEGFVVHYPNKGFFVAEIDEKEAGELFELREALELFSLRKCIENMTKYDLSLLKKINRLYGTAVKTGKTKERRILDREFHMRLSIHHQNDLINRELSRVFERIILKLRTDAYQIQRGVEAHAEHVEIVKAIANKESDKAVNLLTSHIREAHIRLIEQLKV